MKILIIVIVVIVSSVAMFISGFAYSNFIKFKLLVKGFNKLEDDLTSGRLDETTGREVLSALKPLNGWRLYP